MAIYQTLELHNMIMIVRVVFQESNKSYSEVFWDECLCKLQMLYFVTIDVSKGINVKKVHQKMCYLQLSLSFW